MEVNTQKKYMSKQNVFYKLYALTKTSLKWKCKDEWKLFL